MIAVRLGALAFVVEHARIDMVPRNAETGAPGEMMLVLEGPIGGPMPRRAHIDDGQVVGGDGPHIVVPSHVHVVVGGVDCGVWNLCPCGSHADDMLVVKRYV